jgi:hypothetical protein
MPAMLFAGMPYRGLGTGRPRRAYETLEHTSPDAIAQSIRVQAITSASSRPPTAG